MSNATKLRIKCDRCQRTEDEHHLDMHSYLFMRERLSKAGWKITASRDYCRGCKDAPGIVRLQAYARR